MCRAILGETRGAGKKERFRLVHEKMYSQLQA